MISLIITSFKEPNLKFAIDAVLKNKIKEKHEIIIVAPDKEAENLVKSYKNKNIKYFKDPGKGKSLALNQVFKIVKGKILILTDGDVYVSENAVSEILNLFKDPQIGCVTGRPIALNKKDTMLGYWANFLFDIGAHEISRKKMLKKTGFIECSGYLFAFRNIIKEIPLDVAEDSIIPYYFLKKSYKIGYAEKALVYVKNPRNLKDLINKESEQQRPMKN
jgi:cellulose synthase/poly-beta-1,6-N-acetylglucosamine synthase-like glycosyltransferase